MMNIRFHLVMAPLACLFAAILLSGCGDAAAPGAEDEVEAQSDAPTVSIVKAERKTLKRTTTQPATVAAYFEADIHAKAAGYLTELKHDIGDAVEAGEVLGIVSVPEMDKQKERQQAMIRKLEADEKRAASEVKVAEALEIAANAEFKQAEAEVAKAVALVTADQRNLDRTRELVERQSVADRLLDESLKRFESSEAAQQAAEAAVSSAEAHLAVAQSKVAAAKADEDAAKAETDVARKQLEELDALLNYAVLKSPFAGVVTARNVDMGDLVRNTQTAASQDLRPLFSVAQVNKLRVQVAIPENDAPWANTGDKVSLNLRAIPGPPIEAELKRVAGRLDPSTRTMLAEVELDNEGREITLLPGMFGEVTITLAEREALVLPAGVVRYDEQGKAYVYTIGPDNTIARVEVTTGLDNGHEIEIQTGLTGDEQIVAATIGRLAEGQKVQVK